MYIFTIELMTQLYCYYIPITTYDLVIIKPLHPLLPGYFQGITLVITLLLPHYCLVIFKILSYYYPIITEFLMP